MIEVWMPRYKDRKVLVAKYKVIAGENQIVFTKAKHLEGKVFCMSGAKMSEYPLTTNGTITCYEIPMDDFSVRER